MRSTLDSVLTHGAGGAVSGTLAGASGASVAFCIVVRFAGAKGDRIRHARTFLARRRTS